MAGKGTEVGSHFEELREILDRITLSDLMGVCLDTCHVFDAGYDIVNDLDGVLAEFDRVIGLNRLKAVHINDSIFGLSSHKDRHAKIGEGKIGTEAFRRIINHPVLAASLLSRNSNELPGYKAEIELLRAMVEEAKSLYFNFKSKKNTNRFKLTAHDLCSFFMSFFYSPFCHYILNTAPAN